MEDDCLRERAKKVGTIILLLAMLFIMWQTGLSPQMILIIGCILLAPCACVAVIIRRITGRGRTQDLPADAAPVFSPEKEDILNALAGEWDIVPVSTEPNHVSAENTAFTKVTVTGARITLSGPHGRTLTQQINLTRTPLGRLYLDQGTYIEVWNKVEQEIHINSGLNKTLIWRRPRSAVPAPQAAPAPQQPAAVVVLPSWWETMTDANGRMYYKNNYKMTTSWTPPTVEMIADETRERNAQPAEDMEPPPPAYNPPPAFETSSASAPYAY